MIPPSHLFSDFGEAHGKNLFFPSTYSVSLELKMRKEHGGLTEPSQGNTFFYQIIKKKTTKTHTHKTKAAIYPLLLLFHLLSCNLQETPEVRLS